MSASAIEQVEGLVHSDEQSSGAGLATAELFAVASHIEPHQLDRYFSMIFQSYFRCIAAPAKRRERMQLVSFGIELHGERLRPCAPLVLEHIVRALLREEDAALRKMWFTVVGELTRHCYNCRSNALYLFDEMLSPLLELFEASTTQENQVRLLTAIGAVMSRCDSLNPAIHEQCSDLLHLYLDTTPIFGNHMLKSLPVVTAHMVKYLGSVFNPHARIHVSLRPERFYLVHLGLRCLRKLFIPVSLLEKAIRLSLTAIRMRHLTRNVEANLHLTKLGIETLSFCARFCAEYVASNPSASIINVRSANDANINTSTATTHSHSGRSNDPSSRSSMGGSHIEGGLGSDLQSRISEERQRSLVELCRLQWFISHELTAVMRDSDVVFGDEVIRMCKSTIAQLEGIQHSFPDVSPETPGKPANGSTTTPSPSAPAANRLSLSPPNQSEKGTDLGDSVSPSPNSGSARGHWVSGPPTIDRQKRAKELLAQASPSASAIGERERGREEERAGEREKEGGGESFEGGRDVDVQIFVPGRSSPVSFEEENGDLKDVEGEREREREEEGGQRDGDDSGPKEDARGSERDSDNVASPQHQKPTNVIPAETHPAMEGSLSPIATTAGAPAIIMSTTAASTTRDTDTASTANVSANMSTNIASTDHNCKDSTTPIRNTHTSSSSSNPTTNANTDGRQSSSSSSSPALPTPQRHQTPPESSCSPDASTATTLPNISAVLQNLQAAQESSLRQRFSDRRAEIVSAEEEKLANALSEIEAEYLQKCEEARKASAAKVSAEISALQNGLDEDLKRLHSDTIPKIMSMLTTSGEREREGDVE